MTGFGTAEGALGGGRVVVEIRTVNHRHLAVQCRMPAELQRFEGDIRSRLRGHFERGSASVSVRWTELPERAASVGVDLERARAVLAALEQLRSALDVPGEPDLAFIARQPGVLQSAAEDEPVVAGEELLALIDHASSEAVAARAREGADLADDLERRIASMEDCVTVIEARAPERVREAHERLLAAVQELLGNRQLDEARLVQEVAVLAERVDITEEIVRLRSHFRAFQEALDTEGGVGRRLSFLGQEMLREVNTIGSKANDAVIAEAVIDLKAELEKIREQAENIE
jgi:uncharacterized protein (TIGR00255 family)